MVMPITRQEGKTMSKKKYKLLSATNPTSDGEVYVIIMDKSDDFIYSGWIMRKKRSEARA